MQTGKNTLGLLLLGLVMLVAAGCSVHKEMEPLQAPEEINRSFTGYGEEAVPDKWWNAFDDARLNEVISMALADNISLQQAWTRLDQARALARVSGSFKLPSVEASSSAQRRRSGEPGFNPATFQPDKTIDSYNLSATASYQIDLWNRIDAGLQADLLNLSATRKDIEATASTIVASVVEIWFSLAEQQAVLDLLHEQLQVNREFLDLVELRFSQGQASALEVYQQRLQLESTRNQIPQVETTITVLRHQLAVLLGKDPNADIPFPDPALPQMPGLPETGVPADLLRNRPDIRAAELRIYAADRRIAVAVADKFPSLGLSASAGASSSAISNLIDRWFLSIAGNIAATIFDNGRKDAAVTQAEANLRSSYFGWKQTVLNAVREVEDQLVQEAGNRRVYKGILDQIELAENALEQSRRRYVNGLSTYLNVLSSLQSLQQLQRAEVSAYKRVITNRINLYVALGGDWTEALEQPEPVTFARKEKDND